MTVGGSSSWVAVAEGEGVRVAVSRKLKLDGVAVGGETVRPRRPVKKIKQIPRIETILIPTGIRSVRSNEERGCISDIVLPRLYPHLFHYKVLHCWILSDITYRQHPDTPRVQAPGSAGEVVFM